MKSISINNGHSTTTPAKAIKAVGIEVIALMMDDETREHVTACCNCRTDAEFVREYLRRAKHDFVIG